MRTTTFRKRTLIAYEVDESVGAVIINVLGVFYGWQNWEAALNKDQGGSGEAG